MLYFYFAEPGDALPLDTCFDLVVKASDDAGVGSKVEDLRQGGRVREEEKREVPNYNDQKQVQRVPQVL